MAHCHLENWDQLHPGSPSAAHQMRPHHTTRTSLSLQEQITERKPVRPGPGSHNFAQIFHVQRHLSDEHSNGKCARKECCLGDTGLLSASCGLLQTMRSNKPSCTRGSTKLHIVFQPFAPLQASQSGSRAAYIVRWSVNFILQVRQVPRRRMRRMCSCNARSD